MKTDFRNGSNINTGSSMPAHLSSLVLPWMHDETRTQSKASQNCTVPSQCTAPILPTALIKWRLRQHVHLNWNAAQTWGSGHYWGVMDLYQLQQHLAKGNPQLKGWTCVQPGWFFFLGTAIWDNEVCLLNKRKVQSDKTNYTTVSSLWK